MDKLKSKYDINSIFSAQIINKLLFKSKRNNECKKD